MAVRTGQLPSLSLQLLPQATAVNKKVHSVNISGYITLNLHIEVFVTAVQIKCMFSELQ